MVYHLCKIASVSKSGYYRWLANEDIRQRRETNDEQDLLLIKKHFDKRNGKVGALVLMPRWNPFLVNKKDEIDYRDCSTLQELRERVDNYIEYYNTDRYQLTLKKMTPNEYRNHLS